ncbi:DUF2269 family protein [Subtercola vilae]|uniref:DUF2269 family protein n=1 Tax=Subtercola vilae TaxID=2056433 RepID=A0A4T2BDY7_9MICO|nr:DUF2269 family protein [Subtercola vilae]TIH27066.1 DUF2269 family protein [Subtercola vilae]
MGTIFSILHVVATVFIVGPLAIMPMTALRTLRTGDTARAATAAKSLRLFSYLSLIVVITGFGVMGMSDPKYNLTITTPWVLASLIFYAVALLTTLIVTVPALQHADRGALTSAYARTAVSSGLAAFCLTAVVVLMVWKP